MTADGTGARALPPQPNLEHLKNDAKDRLALMRETAPDAKLADAQFVLARDYGFASWRALKDEVEKRSIALDIDKAAPLSAYAGFYRYEPGIVDNFVATVTCEGDQLFLQMSVRPKLALTRESDGWFTYPESPVRYGFGDIQNGHAETLHMVGVKHRRLVRIDAATADKENAARASAAIMQNRPRIPAEIAPQILERYVGHYLAATGPGLGMEITHEAGRLFEQMTGQPRLEIFPESETEFFFRAMPAQIVFRLEKERPSALTLSQSGLVIYFRPVTAEAMAEATAATVERYAEQSRPRTLVAIDAATLPGFVGRYQLTNERVLTVTAQDGHLFGQMTGQSRHELYPESPCDFFFTMMAAQVSFIPDEQGRARHAIFRVSGQKIILPRMEEGG